MLLRLREYLRRRDAVHLVGVELTLVVMLCVSVVVAVTAASPATSRPEGGPVQAAEPLRAAVVLASAPLPAGTAAEGAAGGLIRLQDLSPEAARAWNAANPISTLPNPAAKPFKLAAEGVLDETRAIDCLTAAVYYEAGYESLEGQRAVAQVVLNRMRNPLFPKTVCGVVMQGSERTTGCQFTFTCDGSLARKPPEADWERARKVAVAALNGHVMKKVGLATHYHANYVAPYWSPSLVKVGVVGAHIFYRWTGGLGQPPAFGGRYAGGEMKGLQIATLDNLSRGKTQLAATAAPHEAIEAAPQAADVEAAPAATVAAATEELVKPTEAVPAQVTKPEELDWQGRPRQKGPPRLAMPG